VTVSRRKPATTAGHFPQRGNDPFAFDSGRRGREGRRRRISALKKGDPRGAISAALGFVPVPGLKDAFGLASKLLFKG
jgi:hypothetical protein